MEKRRLLTVEIRVNTELIGYLYIHNEEKYNRGRTLYKIEYYRPDEGSITTKVWHKPKDGAEILIIKALNWVTKNKKK